MKNTYCHLKTAWSKKWNKGCKKMWWKQTRIWKTSGFSEGVGGCLYCPSSFYCFQFCYSKRGSSLFVDRGSIKVLVFQLPQVLMKFWHEASIVDHHSLYTSLFHWSTVWQVAFRWKKYPNTSIGFDNYVASRDYFSIKISVVSQGFQYTKHFNRLHPPLKLPRRLIWWG